MEEKIKFDDYVRERYQKDSEYNRRCRYTRKNVDEEELNVAYEDKTSQEKSDLKKKLISRIANRVNGIIIQKDVVKRRRARKYEMNGTDEDFNKNMAENINFLTERYSKAYDCIEKNKEKEQEYLKKIDELEQVEDSEKKQQDILEYKKKKQQCHMIIRRKYDEIDLEDTELYTTITRDEKNFYDFILDKIIKEGDGKNYDELKKGNWNKMSVKDREYILESVRKIYLNGWGFITEEQMKEIEIRIRTPEVWKCCQVIKEYSENINFIFGNIECDADITDDVKRVLEEMKRMNSLMNTIVEKRMGEDGDRDDFKHLLETIHNRDW